ncbi:hypothetical protein I6N90_01700 [Paenibacillus sp. GSMTC-2017]|uniref:hypothetical protein n=1 Tax=Paenibacillus sp. GSMTC-2017 TaxID=2794350 RepID=UPI0018D9CF48|nr:hypothetical protein [Paenibacillus sp. GSMTC-2017]MBH5316519.1 hypothetical protein [Paenibacillus sp. GSMTC-2017]
MYHSERDVCQPIDVQETYINLSVSYPPPELRLESKHGFSELILTHFEILFEVYYKLQQNNYVAMKYIENPWTWLEFVKEGNELVISELRIEHHEVSYIQTNRDPFVNVKKEYIINERVLWADFEYDLITKAKELIKTIEEINENMVTSKCFNGIKQFILNH